MVGLGLLSLQYVGEICTGYAERKAGVFVPVIELVGVRTAERLLVLLNALVTSLFKV